ncbi:hypothetical protein BDY21DRAFT_6531 [Lineolata rhizophorae]|uniref:Translation initiation factor IF-3, C-terminal domain-containing protein n=1 Tax=Lineolata rhizophorae TaxID=578093 RepID=A0A6A6PFB4_9PEZI|nr:hypothetical protein BDY21DRAFT_6531 [Lineolata rhizophorae]
MLAMRFELLLRHSGALFRVPLLRCSPSTPFLRESFAVKPRHFASTPCALRTAPPRDADPFAAFARDENGRLSFAGNGDKNKRSAPTPDPFRSPRNPRTSAPARSAPSSPLARNPPPAPSRRSSAAPSSGDPFAFAPSRDTFAPEVMPGIRPIDRDISATECILLSSSPPFSGGDPEKTWKLLKQVKENQPGHHLVQVGEQTRFIMRQRVKLATVRIIPASELNDKEQKRVESWAVEKGKKDKKGKAKVQTKEMEMSWVTDRNDLGHKLGRVKEFLDDGKRVEVSFSGKHNRRRAEPEECKNLVNHVRSQILGWKGVKEWKVENGSIGKRLTLYFEAPKN